MAWVGLVVVVLFIAAVLSCLPSKGYTCSECGYWTPDRQDAMGHEKIASLHKMV